MQEADIEPVNTPMDPRHRSAVDWIRSTIGFSTKTDAVRKAVITYAKSLGWQDPLDVAMPPAPNRKARQ